MRVIENVPADQVRADAFGAQYAKLLAYLNPASHKRVLCSGSFWPNDQGDALIEAAAQREGYTFVSLRSLWADDANQALGLFGHAGVAGHPSDLGMRNIAQELFAALEGWLA